MVVCPTGRGLEPAWGGSVAATPAKSGDQGEAVLQRGTEVARSRGSGRHGERGKMEDPWCIVLAGGEGSRLRALTTDSGGRSVPKQFCSLDGGPTLLEHAIARGRSMTDPDRVVASEHRDLWEPLLADVSSENVIAQPRNRGTAALIDLFERRLAHLLAAFREVDVADTRAVERLYDQIQPADSCGWTDLGTPQRVAECLRAQSPARRSQRAGPPSKPPRACAARFYPVGRNVARDGPPSRHRGAGGGNVKMRFAVGGDFEDR